jgi:Ca2+/H+ antiporter, TMEM165/GDT1 family
MLTAFTASLLMVTAAELGDKTFFISLCLAMQYPRRWVFAGSMTALAAMTVLSVLMGQLLTLFPKPWVHALTIGLFLVFGCKLLYDAYRMMPTSAVSCPVAQEEALETIAEASLSTARTWAIFTKTLVMVFIAEWGDRTQFATASLAAIYNPWVVTIGAILAHGFCAAIAVFSGKLIAGRLSERLVTAIGGVLFLVFAAISWFEGAQG